LKGLEDIIQLVLLDWEHFPEGWYVFILPPHPPLHKTYQKHLPDAHQGQAGNLQSHHIPPSHSLASQNPLLTHPRSFTGRDGTAPVDPLYGFTKLSQLYFKAEPSYNARYTVPVLWDKVHETIVSNESSEIIRMFYSAFDSLLPIEFRESSKPNGGLLPPSLLPQIDEMNTWVYATINNGVYKAGLATTQSAYEDSVRALFASLDRIESHLEKYSSEGPYLFGKYLTEADIRLFPTIVRFDVAYYTLFLCNLKSIRYEYPRIQKWLEGLYWDKSEVMRGAFGNTTDFGPVS
jgi:putative glutathione S-transferase